MTQTFTAEILDFQGAVYLRIKVRASSAKVAAILARAEIRRRLGDSYSLGNVQAA